MTALYELEWLGLSECITQDGHRQLDSRFRQQTRFLPIWHSALVGEDRGAHCGHSSPTWGTSPMRPVELPEGRLWRDSHGWLSATAQKWHAPFTSHGLELASGPHPTRGCAKSSAMVPEWMKEDSQVSGLGSEADIRGFHWERKDGMGQEVVDRPNHYNSSSALEYNYCIGPFWLSRRGLEISSLCEQELTLCFTKGILIHLSQSLTALVMYCSYLPCLSWIFMWTIVSTYSAKILVINRMLMKSSSP